MIANQLDAHLSKSCGFELSGMGVATVGVLGRDREFLREGAPNEVLRHAAQRLRLRRIADDVSQHKAPTWAKHAECLGEEKLAGVEMEGALDGGHDIA